MIKNAFFWPAFLFVFFFFTGLAHALPVLGETKNGRYTHPNNMFSCPLPGPSLGLRGPLRIEDAAKIVKRRRVLRPNHLRALFEGPLYRKPASALSNGCGNAALPELAGRE